MFSLIVNIDVKIVELFVVNVGVIEINDIVVYLVFNDIYILVIWIGKFVF